MNKKEEIKHLKRELKIYKAHAAAAIMALEPYQKLASQRGGRMQVMHDYMKEVTDIPIFIKVYFDKDGIPLP